MAKGAKTVFVCGECGYESFLRQIQSLIGVTDAAADETIDRFLVAAQKFAERRLPSAKRQRRQLAVAA